MLQKIGMHLPGSHEDGERSSTWPAPTADAKVELKKAEPAHQNLDNDKDDDSKKPA